MFKYIHEHFRHAYIYARCVCVHGQSDGWYACMHVCVAFSVYALWLAGSRSYAPMFGCMHSWTKDRRSNGWMDGRMCDVCTCTFL